MTVAAIRRLATARVLPDGQGRRASSCVRSASTDSIVSCVVTAKTEPIVTERRDIVNVYLDGLARDVSGHVPLDTLARTAKRFANARTVPCATQLVATAPVKLVGEAENATDRA